MHGQEETLPLVLRYLSLTTPINPSRPDHPSLLAARKPVYRGWTSQTNSAALNSPPTSHRVLPSGASITCHVRAFYEPGADGHFDCSRY
jgi:hypothetical protein